MDYTCTPPLPPLSVNITDPVDAPLHLSIHLQARVSGRPAVWNAVSFSPVTAA